MYLLRLEAEQEQVNVRVGVRDVVRLAAQDAEDRSAANDDIAPIDCGMTQDGLMRLVS